MAVKGKQMRKKIEAARIRGQIDTLEVLVKALDEGTEITRDTLVGMIDELGGFQTPDEAAAELGKDPREVRAALRFFKRENIEPFASHKKGNKWKLTSSMVTKLSMHFTALEAEGKA